MARKRVREKIAFDDEKNLYYAYFDQGLGMNGKRQKFAKTFVTLEEAMQALDRFEAEGQVSAQHITLESWLNYWLEDVVRQNLEYTTHHCYQNMVKNHIVPALGDIPLQELMPYHIQRYYTEMTRTKQLSTNTVHKHHILLHTALKLAFRQGVLLYNPIDRVEPPKEHPTQRRFYTPQQLKRLLETVDGTDLELVIKLAGYLGLRRGEICGLRWKDVDFEQNIIFIRSTRTTAGGVVVEKKPKSENSTRCLSIEELPDLIELLLRTRHQQCSDRTELLTEYDGGYVLTRADGHPRNPDQVTRRVNEFISAHCLPPITVHGLRHTFASVANSAHIPLLDISKALGHKDVVVTGRIYTHIFDQTHGEAVSAVARCIREA